MKLYLVTRADLEPCQRAVQLCHALREVAAVHPELDKSWYVQSNTLVLLEVDTEDELQGLSATAGGRGVRRAEWREPDLDNALTAVAIGPEGKRICRGLRLALQSA